MNTPARILSILALGAAVSAAPAAFAEPNKAVTLRFEFDRSQPAEATYARLNREALDACAFHGSRSIVLQRIEQVCADRLVDKAVAELADDRISYLHNDGGARHAVAGADFSGR
jgi:hypothetical protein